MMDKSSRPFECVLPDSGRFALVRKATWRDILESIKAQNLMLPTLASKLVTLDGHSYTVEEWLDFDFEDIAPVMNEINRRLVGMQGRKGAA